MSCSKPSLSLDEDFLYGYWDKLLSECRHMNNGHKYMQNLRAFLENNDLTMGTGCSGTECPGLCGRAAEKVFKKHGIDANFFHVFSCEVNKRKCDWILALFPKLENMFQDVTLLGGRSAPNYVKGGRLSRIPRVLLFVAGFCCTNASTHNQDRALFEFCINDENGNTGKTFGGVLDYVVTHEPLLLIFENVLGLVGPNLLEVQRLLRLAGYTTRTYRVSTDDYLLPQSRKRLYIIGVRTDYLTGVAASDDDFINQLDSFMMQFRFPDERMPLSEFLFPDDDSHVRVHLETAAIVQHRGETSTWMEKHLKHVGSEKWLSAPEPLAESIVDSYPGYKMLTNRQVDILSCLSIVLPEQVSRVIDVSQSASRAGLSRRECSQTVTPTGQFFVTDKVRLLLGREALRVQGIFVSNLILNRFSEHMLQDLAGNAMSSTVISSCMMALLLTVAVLSDGHGKFHGDSNMDVDFDNFDARIAKKIRVDGPVRGHWDEN